MSLRNSRQASGSSRIDPDCNCSPGSSFPEPRIPGAASPSRPWSSARPTRRSGAGSSSKSATSRISWPAQVRVLRLQLGPGVDAREAYVDQVLLNVYGGPGTTNVWIDDLEIAGYAESLPGAPRPVAVNPRLGNLPAVDPSGVGLDRTPGVASGGGSCCRIGARGGLSPDVAPGDPVPGRVACAAQGDGIQHDLAGAASVQRDCCARPATSG